MVRDYATMSVRLSADEAWNVLARSHTGILTTLRRDGMPIALPVWFVALDRTICMSAPSRTKKLARIRHDPRASFLVESGERWVELEAVHLTGRVEIVEDDTLVARIGEAIQAKYAPFQSDHAKMPEATQQHYAGRTFLRLVPDERILSWNNGKIELRA
jgi:PPOX class probable F420-dependent enzyme